MWWRHRRRWSTVGSSFGFPAVSPTDVQGMVQKQKREWNGLAHQKRLSSPTCLPLITLLTGDAQGFRCFPATTTVLDSASSQLSLGVLRVSR